MNGSKNSFGDEPIENFPLTLQYPSAKELVSLFQHSILFLQAAWSSHICLISNGSRKLFSAQKVL